MSIRKEAKAEKQRLKNMSWKDRARHVWEYYKFHILVPILAASALRIVGTMVYHQTSTTRLSMAVINDRAGTTSSTAGPEARLKEAPGCGSKGLIEFSEGLPASFSEDSTSQYGYAALVKIPALVASRPLGVVIGGQTSIGHYASISAYQNLEEYLLSELYHKVKDHIYRANDKQGSLQSFTISLEDTVFAQETGIPMDPPCLAVISGAPHKEVALVMVGYLLP